MTQAINSLGPWVWGWMASHPIQSLVVMTSTILIGFSVETKIWEKKRVKVLGSSVALSVVEGDPPVAPTTASSSTVLGDQFLATDADGEQKVRARAIGHESGILIQVKQTLDRDRAFPCVIVLTDLKHVVSGKQHTVPELHKLDGSFRYGRINLELAGSNENLYFNNTEQWWLVQGNSIVYYWGSNKTRGEIAIAQGTWTAHVEILVGDQKLDKEFTYAWHGSGAAKLVD